MYLKEIKFQNYGALKDVNYTFQFNPDGTPKPTVFIGKNGSGKTLLLSNIIHALIEMKRHFYHEISETSDQNFYRVGSKSYIYCNKNHAYTKISFDNNVNYTELMVYNYEEFKKAYEPNDYPLLNMNDKKLKDTGHFSIVGKPTENVFENEIFSFFPVERYYIPTWENKRNDKLRFAVNDASYIGYDDNSMIKNNILQDIEAWILDVLVDQHLYENKTFSGKNTDIVNTINNILSHIFMRHHQNVWVNTVIRQPHIPTATEHQYQNIGA